MVVAIPGRPSFLNWLYLHGTVFLYPFSGTKLQLRKEFPFSARTGPVYPQINSMRSAVWNIDLDPDISTFIEHAEI